MNGLRVIEGGVSIAAKISGGLQKRYKGQREFAEMIAKGRAPQNDDAPCCTAWDSFTRSEQQAVAPFEVR